MKDLVGWSSLLVTVFTLVLSSHSDLINRPPTLPETEDGLLATVRARVTVFLGDGESCTAETITEASTQTGRKSPGATTTTITEAIAKTVSGCRNSPTLNGIADVGIARVAASVSAVIALLENGPIKTVTDYTTKTITSCACTDDSASVTGTSQSSVTPTSSSIPATTTSSMPPTASTTSTTIGDSTTTPPGTTVPAATTVTTRTTSSPAVPSSSTADTTLTQSSSSTTTVSASVCSSLINNPTYTPSAALPYDYTWGCAPGYLCKPPHTGDRLGCNIEAGLPDPGYICNPSDCIVAPPLDVHPGWQYNVSNNYYNLNPVDFGLNYSIFQFSEDPVAANSKRDMSLRDFDVAQKTKRADITNIPNVCFNDCNVAAREPEMLGKTSELCKSGSTFMENLGICEECITNNRESGSDAYSSKMLPTFAQWLNYCSDMVTSTTQESATTTKIETTTTSTLVTDLTTTTSTKATTVATITTTRDTSTKVTRTEVTRTEENSAKFSSTEDTSTEPNDTQSTEKSSSITGTEETPSPIERTPSVILITASASGSSVTTSLSGSLVTTSFSESVVTMSTSGSLVTSSVPGSIMTTSVSGSLITTSLPDSIKTMSSTLSAGSGDENTSDNASGSTSGSVRGNQTGSASPSVFLPSYNAAGLMNIPHIGLMGLLWAAFATLL
ncbi:hypothetical protein N7491_000984 [Penicillium cf. griseofulvum]|uniref:Uncharacterized protein n=1 Tax=Penicillium cf. griseofulvum TaxID=2972120 RepID=A0A9W9JBE3_9EURO|nr:hypothetical protein N7472_006119 [Penicillium cf. griseofulvum]KAJ5444902.1 hypothetical protein N7491_000984 [Penicillium cf. griseofulvum]KAJ5446616.1 hypothetical protein N7445_001437 [Penicillium cf. griseofulvum]